jgi:hypothetical protein
MSTNNGIKISLENCDFNKKRTRINSPNSLIACELIGIDPEDLIYLTKDEYIRVNQECQNLDKELQEERYNHFNSRRIKLIEDVKKKREELLEENNSFKNSTNYNSNNNRFNNFNDYSTQSKTFYDKKGMKKSASSGAFEPGGGNGGTTAIKLERERLKKLKERQEINIRLQIDYECAMEENRRKNIEKMKMKEEKEEKKKLEKHYKLLERLRKEEIKEKEKKRKEEEYKQKM